MAVAPAPEQRIAIVTGATDGIGKQTALELLGRGLFVVVHGRNEAKAKSAAQEIGSASGKPESVTSAAADFSRLDEVRSLAASLKSRFPRIDVLVNNAGIFMHERVLTDDGHEMTFAVNHYAPFLLTLSLMPALRSSPAARVITVSSVAHSRARLDFDDLESVRRYDGYGAYSTSKLANVLFSNELARRLANTPMTSNALHPGVISTKLLREGFGSSGASLERGAALSVKLATEPVFATMTGRYFSDDREVTPSPTSRDPKTQLRLWEISVLRTGAPDLLPNA